MDVLVVGSVALDSIETPFGQVTEILGGSATHFACSARFFADVGLVGVVGKDFPEHHTELLASREIDLAGLERADGKTFRWRGYYEYDLNQAHSLETQLNVFETFHPRLPGDYTAAPCVFLANIDPELQMEVLDQVRSPKLVVCDTMNFWIESKRDALIETLGRVDIALMNDSEARELCGTYSLVESARKILSWGPSTVILKKGEHGALMFTESTHFSAPAYPLEDIKDPTGAGDSFAGGFVGHLAATRDFSETNTRRAVIYGSVMASFNVEGFGAERVVGLDEGEVAARYEGFKGITAFE